jgi:hypothetical protein
MVAAFPVAMGIKVENRELRVEATGIEGTHLL